MNRLIRQPMLISALLFLWLFASGLGLHGHYCFDGSEPPVSVHFDVIADQDHVSDGLGQKDFDSKPAEMAFLKLFSVDLPFLLTALLLLVLWPPVGGQQYARFKIPSSWIIIAGLRPPLRAPPAISC